MRILSVNKYDNENNKVYVKSSKRDMQVVVITVWTFYIKTDG